MITRCPQYHAWFRVTAEHLREANGFVTCGECDAVFNALTTLIEETASPDTLQHAPVAQTAAPTITQTRRRSKPSQTRRRRTPNQR
ncbi:MAG: MJ0042-type zinc finger domain-containing protein [Pseudomonadota bacterium]|nr:MJ0042-type zinc finger domain-containing protein [Pseudomonadota bacterium]